MTSEPCTTTIGGGQDKDKNNPRYVMLVTSVGRSMGGAFVRTLNTGNVRIPIKSAFGIRAMACSEFEPWLVRNSSHFWFRIQAMVRIPNVSEPDNFGPFEFRMCLEIGSALYEVMFLEKRYGARGCVVGVRTNRRISAIV
jgi:hypothetical protein